MHGRGQSPSSGRPSSLDAPSGPDGRWTDRGRWCRARLRGCGGCARRLTSGAARRGQAPAVTPQEGTGGLGRCAGLVVSAWAGSDASRGGRRVDRVGRGRRPARRRPSPTCLSASWRRRPGGRTASIGSFSVAPSSFAYWRWEDSWSALPPAVSATTVIRLRSSGDSCGRFQTSPEEHGVGDVHQRRGRRHRTAPRRPRARCSRRRLRSGGSCQSTAVMVSAKSSPAAAMTSKPSSTVPSGIRPGPGTRRPSPAYTTKMSWLGGQYAS